MTINESKYTEQRKINKMSIPKPENSNGVLCRRAKIDTGTFCNYHCFFCYYKKSLDKKDTFEQIKERIDFVVNQGFKEVDLSGGESSIHENWFEILDYCNSKDLHISCLTNGSTFHNFKFLEKSYNKGLKEILFSLHGHNKEVHESITGVKGSYTKIIKAIKNAKELGIKVRINCTINEKNFKCLTEYAELINDINPFQVNFITLNKWDNNETNADYGKISKELKIALDILEIQNVNIRYIPFCYLKDYEKNLVGFYQHIYDIYDWDMSVFNFDKISSKEEMFKTAKSLRLGNYMKKRDCMFCKHFKICDGIDNGIDVFPDRGVVIENVNYYRHAFYE